MRVAAIIKYMLSFLKRNWKASDYPLRTRHQDQSSGEGTEWSVQVINWWGMWGFGESRAEALRDLDEKLAAYREHRGDLPRPGTRAPLEFASTERVEQHASTVDALLTRVLGFNAGDPVFLSDQSSLWHFCEGETLEELFAKIRSVFGVDVSDVTDGNIATILERIDGACRSADRGGRSSR